MGNGYLFHCQVNNQRVQITSNGSYQGKSSIAATSPICRAVHAQRPVDTARFIPSANQTWRVLQSFSWTISLICGNSNGIHRWSVYVYYMYIVILYIYIVILHTHPGGNSNGIHRWALTSGNSPWVSPRLPRPWHLGAPIWCIHQRPHVARRCVLQPVVFTRKSRPFFLITTSKS